MKNDYVIHHKYFLTKMVFVVANLIKLCSLARMNCSLTHGDSDCIESQLDAQFCVDVIWTFFEMYCTVIVYAFCLKVNKGVYGPIGGTPIFIDFNLVDLSIYKKGICLESQGYKVKNWLGKQEVEVGIELAKNWQEPQVEKDKKQSYWRIFPKPLLRESKKEVEVCDLSVLMELQAGE